MVRNPRARDDSNFGSISCPPLRCGSRRLCKASLQELAQKTKVFRSFSATPVNKGLGPVDSLWEHRQIWLRLLALLGLRAFVRERLRAVELGYRPEVQANLPVSGRDFSPRRGDAKRTLLPTQNRTTCSLCALAALREKGFSCSWIGSRPGPGRLSMELRRGLVAARRAVSSACAKTEG